MTNVLSINVFAIDKSPQLCSNTCSIWFSTELWAKHSTAGNHLDIHVTYEDLKHISDIGLLPESYPDFVFPGVLY